jgi:hypothetical protein
MRVETGSDSITWSSYPVERSGLLSVDNYQTRGSALGQEAHEGGRLGQDGYARRWLARLADERPLTPAELDLAVTALRALPSRRARDALRALL